MRVQYFNLKRNQSGLSWWCEWCVCQGITSRQDPRWKMLCREEILMFRFLPYLPLVWYGGKECSSLHDLKALVMTWENVYVWECWCFISPPLSFLVFQDGWSQDTEERVTAEAAASGIGCPMGNVFQGLGVTEVLSLMYPESVRIKDAELFFHRLFSLEFQRWWSSLKPINVTTWVLTCRLEAKYLESVMGVHTRIQNFSVETAGRYSEYFSLLPPKLDQKRRENKTFVIQFQVFL